MSSGRVFRDLCRENTGRSMLDSGDHYGRHHERGWIADDSPVVTWGKYGPTIHTGALLDYWYDADQSLQDAYDIYAESHPDRSHYGLIEDFAESRGWYECSSDNTYNGESDLDQVFQWWVYATSEGVAKGDWYYASPDQLVIVIQTHNGCDVRGGYSSPRFVRLADNGMIDAFPIPSVVVQLTAIKARDGDGEDIPNPHDVSERWSTGWTSAPYFDMQNECRIFDFTRNESEATCVVMDGDANILKLQAEVEGVY
jgi:hypothetical protein